MLHQTETRCMLYQVSHINVQRQHDACRHIYTKENYAYSLLQAYEPNTFILLEFSEYPAVVYATDTSRVQSMGNMAAPANVERHDWQKCS